jgi:hypothetical protein
MVVSNQLHMDVDQVLDNPPSDRVYDYVPPTRKKADFKNEIDAFLDEELNGSSDDSGSSDEQMGVS